MWEFLLKDKAFVEELMDLVRKQGGLFELLKLDPSKKYILVLPEDMDTEEVRKAFVNTASWKVDLVVVQSDHVKLIELE